MLNYFKHGLCLALVGAGLAAAPGLQTAAAGQSSAAPGDDLLQRMRTEAQGPARISLEKATGKVGFVRASRTGDLLPSRSGDSTAAAIDKATAFLDEYAAAFGARPGELEQERVQSGKLGWTITYTQAYRGVPVFGAKLLAHVDKGGDLTSVNGYAAPDLDLDVSPAVSEAAAAERAVAIVHAQPPGEGSTSTAGIKAIANELVVYRLGSTRGESGEAVLARVVEVSNDSNIRDIVILDATTNKPVNRYSLVHDALERELYEADEDRKLTLVWEDGDAFPGSLDSEQQSLVLGAGNTYWLFHNAFGRDSYDDNGATMKTVNNDPAISCPNASWNGSTTNYCNGVTSDDTVTHEWAHAYTEYTSGLIYQWQAGALNESYSDIWGEAVDMVNGRQNQGDDTTKRPVGQCSTQTRGPIAITINSPAEVAGPCDGAAPAQFGPVFERAGTTADVVVATDEDEDGGAGDATDLDGCSAFSNAAQISGKWAYVDRGFCFFQDKIDNAEAAGALGIVVGNNNPDEEPFTIFGQSDLYGAMVTKADGDRIKSAGAVNITVRDSGTDERVNSFRWLSGEGDPGFGGAIRDMWEPTCYGDPGKVSDAEYHCTPDDGGGVHRNSGVSNHAFALLVDGGVYNDVTVPGIGLDKAAHVYWRAQSAYLTPTSDFVDQANALDAACQDLLGQEIRAMSTKRETPGEVVDPIGPGDCIAVAAASDAVELRAEPEQCEFRRLLKKGAPSLCGKSTRSVTVWKEGFSDGLKGWTKGEKIPRRSKGHGLSWRTSKNARQHSSRAAYVPAPSAGQCDFGRQDLSSSNSITSRRITMPALGVRSTLSFRHYVATEDSVDGGNVKIKIGKGKFKVVPASAFAFNAYPGRLLSKDVGNTHSLSGERAFSGTDGGTVFGSWGQSQINLKKVGVRKGDAIRIRFDFGRDGCGGNDGWYVDTVKIVKCVKKGDHNKLSTKR